MKPRRQLSPWQRLRSVGGYWFVSITLPAQSPWRSPSPSLAATCKPSTFPIRVRPTWRRPLATTSTFAVVQGRDFRLTDIYGNVVEEIRAFEGCQRWIYQAWGFPVNVYVETNFVLEMAVDRVLSRMKEDASLRSWITRYSQDRMSEGKSWNIKNQLFHEHVLIQY